MRTSLLGFNFEFKALDCNSNVFYRLKMRVLEYFTIINNDVNENIVL